MPHRAGRNELKPAQRAALAALEEGSAEELTRGEYQQLTGVSRSQAAYDLAELVEAGLVERLGGGRSTRYRRPRRSQPSHRHWTNQRIRAALVEFCAGRTTWPSAGEFKAAGHTDLYVAASRYGGIGFWASELGFSGPARTAPRRRRTRSLRPLLTWAATAAAFAAVLLGVSGAVHQPQGATPTREAAGAPTARNVVRELAPPSTAQAKSKPARAVRRSTVHRIEPTVRSNAPSYRSRLAAGSRRELAAQTISAPVISTPRQQPTVPPAVTAGGVAPLRAPAGKASAPSPLPSPRQ